MTETSDGDRFYKIDPLNRIDFEKTFASVCFIKFNSRNETFIFEQSDEMRRSVWVLTPDHLGIVNLFNYSASGDMEAFFDYGDILFLDTSSGINILREAYIDPDVEHIPLLIPRLTEFHFKGKNADFHTSGTGYFVFYTNTSKYIEQIGAFTSGEIVKPAPRFYLYNFDRFGEIYRQKSSPFGYFLLNVHRKGIIRFGGDNVTMISGGNHSFEHGDIFITNNRVFIKYFENGACYIKEYKSDDSLTDTGITLKNSCNIYHTFDKFDTAYFGSSEEGSIVKFIKINGTTQSINLPNSMFIFGLATTDDGSLWILGQSIFVVPFGEVNAARVGGYLFLEKPWPFKSRPRTNEVFIGLDDGLYLATP